jgi:tryptophanyl-tRNA synthetase
LGYPVLQTADICLYRGEIVPVGEDQLPHLYIAADIAQTFRYRYGDIFPVPEAKIMEVFARIPGTDNRKMSKSYGNAINISDDEETTKRMILTYYTDPKKPRKGDKGHPDECPVFYLHRLYLKGEPLEVVRQGCESGDRMCYHCKEELASEVNEALRPIRLKRDELKGDRKKLQAILEEGAESARAVAAEVIADCRKAIGIDRK